VAPSRTRGLSCANRRPDSSAVKRHFGNASRNADRAARDTCRIESVSLPLAPAAGAGAVEGEPARAPLVRAGSSPGGWDPRLLREPLELIAKLSILIPPPRFTGCAVTASWRRRRGGGRCSCPARGRAPVRRAVVQGRASGPGRGRARRRCRPSPPGGSPGGRCWPGCSPLTSFSAPAAAAAGGSWGCTPGVSVFGSCASGWGW
jgi:hypothetical protein